MALVFGRCQKELPKRHVAWIEIHGAQPRRAVFFGYFKFNVVCPKLDIDNRFAVNEILVAEKSTHWGHADFFFVVVGEREGEGGQVQVFFAEFCLENTADGFHGFGVFREDTNDDFHFGRSSNFTHARKFSKSAQGDASFSEGESINSSGRRFFFCIFSNMMKNRTLCALAVILSSLVCTLSSNVFAEAPRVVPTILDSVPHETSHFTQGLSFDGKELIETTGLYGKSGLYRRTQDGKILDSARIEERYFGEGSVVMGDEIYYLTWKSHKAFIYSRKPFKKKGEFRIPTEGWGLTLWQDQLLMSNGTDELLQIAPGGYNVTRIIKVHDGRYSIKLLNELEIVGNTLYANIWQTDLIAEIELPSGKVLRYIDFSKKAGEIREKFPGVDVLNGIAYDGKDFWITGKLWPQIYKVKF